MVVVCCLALPVGVLCCCPVGEARALRQIARILGLLSAVEMVLQEVWLGRLSLVIGCCWLQAAERKKNLNGGPSYDKNNVSSSIIAVETVPLCKDYRNDIPVPSQAQYRYHIVKITGKRFLRINIGSL